MWTGQTLPPMKRQPMLLLFITLILLIGFGLRAHRLAYDSIWWDEGFSVVMSRLPILEMLPATASDAHPPLSYALLHSWMQLVGQEEFSLRVLSVFFGLGTVAIAYQIGREASGRTVGAASAILIAVARLPVWWSQEIRMYAPATFFAAVLFWMAIRLFIARKYFWWNVLILALVTGAGLLTLYLFAGAVIAANLAFVVAFILQKKRWRLLLGWAASQVGALILFVPWVFYTIPRLPSWESPQAPVELWQVVQLYFSVIFLGISTEIERYLPVLVLAFILSLVAVTFIVRQASRKDFSVLALLLIGVVLPPILIYLLSLPRGQFNYPTPSPRYFLLLSTPVYVLLGWGVVKISEQTNKWAGACTIGLLVVGSLVSLGNYYQGLYLRDDYITMAATLDALRAENDAVVLNNDTDWPIFAYHYDEPFERHLSKTQTVRDWKYAEGLMSRYRTEATGVWLVQTQYAEVTDPEKFITQYLDERSWSKHTFDFPEGQLIYYALQEERFYTNGLLPASSAPADIQPLSAPIADGVMINGFVLAQPELYTGTALPVGLGWDVSREASDRWPVALQAVAPNGEIVGSTLFDLPGPSGVDALFQPYQVFIPPSVTAEQATIYFVAGQKRYELGDVRIIPQHSVARDGIDIPDTATYNGSQFGEFVTLAAVDVPMAQGIQAGETLPIRLYWQASGTLPERYKVFVHVVGEAYNEATNNTVWGQQDQEPQGGAAPTNSWRAGDTIIDEYRIPISEEAPAGTYRVVVGLYLPFGGGRLPAISDAGFPLGDSVEIMEFKIE